MLQVGFGFTVTVRVHWVGQLSRVTLSVRVKVPAPLAVTLTEAPVVDPLMVPFPLMDQLCVTVPPVGSTVEVYVWVVAAQIVPLPLMDQLCVTVPPAGSTVEV